MNKLRKTIKVEVEIEFEYDPNHFNVSGMGDEYVDAIAKDMAFQNAARNIQDGVKLIHVCNRDENAWWLINSQKHEEQ